MMMDYMIGLIFVSVVSGVLILMIKAMSPLFKSRYSIGLKQLLWIMLAIRLLIPFSYGNTFFTITAREGKNGAKQYETNRITQGQAKQPETTYITLPDKISREEALASQSYAELIYKHTNSKKPLSFSDNLVSVAAEDTSGNLYIKEEKTLAEKLQYHFLRIVNFVNTHQMMGIIYVSGVALFLIYHIFAILFYRRRRNRERMKVENEAYLDLLQKTTKRIGVRRVPMLYEIESLSSPMATGFFCYSIYLPKEEYSTKELSAIFSHELIHIRHQDLRLKVLYLIVNALHWFNPLVWLMLKEAGRDMELYCDKTVVELYDRQERNEYNELLLNILKNHTEKTKQEYLTTCFNGGVKEMKERFLENLDMRKKREGMLPTILAALLIAMSAGVFSIQTQALEDVTQIYAVEEDSFLNRTQMLKALSSDSNISYRDAVLRYGYLIGGMYDNTEDDDYVETYPVEESVYMEMEEKLANMVGISYQAGDPAVEEYEVIDYKKDGESLYGIPYRMNEEKGKVLVNYTVVSSDRKPLEVPPEVDIYCRKTPIAEYGIRLNEWESGDKTKVVETPDFFRTQCAKGEENPLFLINGLKERVDEICFYFPVGQEPDFIEVEDRVYNEDGSLRYAGMPLETIFRIGYVDQNYSNVRFELEEHDSIREYDFALNMSDVIEHIYFRGFSVNCYWANEDGYQSCTYEFVLRTQSK